MLKHARVRRGSDYYTGWVLCWPDGNPITTDNLSAKIRVSASGTYMTA